MGLKQDYKKAADSLELTYQWYAPYHRMGCIFLSIWVLLSTVIYHPELIALVRGELIFPQNLFALVLFIMMVLVPGYWVLLCKFNRTTVELNASEVKVWNGPLPCWRGNSSLAQDDIRFLRIEERRSDSKEYGSRDLIAMMKNGEVKKILMDIKDPDDSRKALDIISRSTQIPSFQGI